MTPKAQTRVLFLNQVAGPLFRELAEDVAKQLGSGVLLSGHTQGIAREMDPRLRVVAAPDYDRRNLLTRAWSWLRYFVAAFWQAWTAGRGTLLFLVSNPPFLPLVGYILHRFRGQRYVVLVYDIYPNLLESLGRIRKGGLLARVWRAFNRLVWGHADVVFTIGDYMAANIKAMVPTGSQSPTIVVVPNWADATFVKPLPKEANWFATEHNQLGKLTVLYSGNLGSTHDIETLIAAAAQFKEDPRLCFLIIGAGTKWAFVERTLRQQSLSNVTLLPFQPEKDIPFTLTTADVSVVTLEKGIEGLSVPSKTAYALASGAALLVISHSPNELTAIIDRHQCGMAVEPGDTKALVAALTRFRDDPQFLQECKVRSRRAMEQSFSRANATSYVAALQPLVALTSKPTGIPS